MKVLFAASEADPFAMSGGLADVSGALPKALRKRLVGCRVIMPLYSSISEELRQKMDEAVAVENFEAAAQYRDEMRALAQEAGEA